MRLSQITDGRDRNPEMIPTLAPCPVSGDVSRERCGVDVETACGDIVWRQRVETACHAWFDLFRKVNCR